MHPVVACVAETIRSQELLQHRDSTILIALSGGTDSVALLRVLQLLGYEHLVALHCNFHLRGEESNRDEASVRALTERLGVPLLVEHFETESYAQERGISVEMAARELRYAWFTQVRAEHYPNATIAVAHNADDVLETQLLNLISGTGLRGLSGMPYVRYDGVIRPLMQVHRSDIEDFARSEGLAVVHDSSNDDVRYRRNYIRHRILPAFEELNPAYRQTGLRTIEHLRSAERLYQYAIESLSAQVMTAEGIRIMPLLSSPEPMTLAFELLRPYDFDGDMCQLIVGNLAHPSPGRRYYSSTHELIEGREYLELCPRERSLWQEVELDLSQDGALDTPLGRLYWCMKPRAEVQELFRPSTEALFDWDKLSEHPPITLRRRAEGDRLYPYGMKGSKLLRRIFIDRHFMSQEREQALLLCCSDSPIWLLGHIVDRRYRVSETTKLVICLRLE